MITKLGALAHHLEQAVRDFAEIAVIGVSGGVDSAVVASVATAALGPDSVYLVSMPYGDSDRNTFNKRSAELADTLGAKHLVVPVSDATEAILSSLRDEFALQLGSRAEFHALTGGNTRARVRMAVLYGVCGELTYRLQEKIPPHEPVSAVRGQVFTAKRIRVLGTGNASEDLIGYDTKGGDALADLFVIGDLFKSEVYQLAKYYSVPSSIIQAAPSAGLYEGQTDHAELGYSYEELEPALAALHRCLFRGVRDEELSASLRDFAGVEKNTAEFVIRRFRANAHKHRAPVVVAVRHTDLVKDIWSV